MNYCKYSIIPTPTDDMRYSSCAKKLEGAPHYPQVMQFFLNIKRSAYEFQYVGVGLGVPMCKGCHDDITMQTEKTHDSAIGIIVLFLTIVLFMILGWTAGEKILPLAAPIVLGLFIYIYVKETSKYEESNDLIRDKGLDKIDAAINQLEKNSWRQNMSKTVCKNYSPECLRLELDGICAGGRYSLLNITTGYIEDFHDPETLEKIYKGSIFIEEKDFDGDFDGD